MKNRILKAYNDGKAILCATEEESLKFRTILHEAGVKWVGGGSLINSYGHIPYKYGKGTDGGVVLGAYDRETVTFSSLLTLPADFCIQCPSDYATNDKWKAYLLSCEIPSYQSIKDLYYSKLPFLNGGCRFGSHPESKEVIDLDDWYEATNGEAEWQPKEGEIYEFSDNEEDWHVGELEHKCKDGSYVAYDKVDQASYFYEYLRPVRAIKYTLTEAKQIIAKAEGKTVEQIEIIIP